MSATMPLKALLLKIETSAARLEKRLVDTRQPEFDMKQIQQEMSRYANLIKNLQRENERAQRSIDLIRDDLLRIRQELQQYGLLS